MSQLDKAKTKMDTNPQQYCITNIQMQYSFTIKTAKTWKEEQNQKGRRRVGGKVERKMASEEKEGELGKKIEKCREILISNFYLWLLEGNELTLVCIYCLSLSFEEKDVIFALELNDTFFWIWK